MQPSQYPNFRLHTSDQKDFLYLLAVNSCSYPRSGQPSICFLHIMCLHICDSSTLKSILQAEWLLAREKMLCFLNVCPWWKMWIRDLDAQGDLGRWFCLSFPRCEMGLITIGLEVVNWEYIQNTQLDGLYVGGAEQIWGILITSSPS